MLLQRNLSKRATCGPVMTDLYREVAALYSKVDCNGLVLCSLDPWEALCFREVHGYLYTVARQVSLYVVCMLILCESR